MEHARNYASVVNGAQQCLEPNTVPTADEWVANVRAFRDLPSDVLAVLSGRCPRRHYSAGQNIVSCGDNSREVFFILEGKARVTFFTISGREISFRDLSSGEMFGELSAIDGESRSADVVALTNSTISIMPVEVFWNILREHASFRLVILRKLTSLVRLLLERVVELSTLTVPIRIQTELLRIAYQNALDQEETVIFPAPTHSAIATRVSTHREAVTRELSQLARAGIIKRCGRTMIIRDVSALADMVSKAINK
jgi:CRP-like cAMP-binding protein